MSVTKKFSAEKLSDRNNFSAAISNSNTIPSKQIQSNKLHNTSKNMRVFVTGASGWVGRHVTISLIARGHRVLGLARSEKSEELLKKLGAEVKRGDMTDLECLKKAAQECDAVIHCAFNHDNILARFAVRTCYFVPIIASIYRLFK